jgi:hypothetical protein
MRFLRQITTTAASALIAGSVEVQLAIGIEELPDNAPLIGTMRRLAEEDRIEDGPAA